MKKNTVYETTKSVRQVVRKIDTDCTAGNWDAVVEGFGKLGAIAAQFDLDYNAVEEAPAEDLI